MGLNLVNIKKALEDVTTLEVATLTNPQATPINLSEAKTNSDIFTKVQASLGSADLVAYTKYELDGDSVNFITQNENLTRLVNEHNELVKSSLETRKVLFNTIYDAVKDII
ncbi:hypothetical protein [Aureibacter tunicatorum]|uniref:Uncharacterized protein n=1 Tax=Aureibacter tunicatorum TaxID=866807 RepID=A0AAE3XS00_9BACT|nr:hypothetical protein [Aureibacter tunicatorum]MDR6241013.1 hypothetical protein [Aureibacter tunicatorum]BDD03791.1 hypothetical protein AUTU_12740 [Aureibacter tunicatorum]